MEGGGQENGKKVVTPDSIDKKKKNEKRNERRGEKMNEWMRKKVTLKPVRYRCAGIITGWVIILWIKKTETRNL